jgi:hypothetical protein
MRVFPIRKINCGVRVLGECERGNALSLVAPYVSLIETCDDRHRIVDWAPGAQTYGEDVATNRSG